MKIDLVGEGSACEVYRTDKEGVVWRVHKYARSDTVDEVAFEQWLARVGKMPLVELERPVI